MPAYQLILIGVLIGMILTIGAVALLSKKSDPDPERRNVGHDRRKRNNTRAAVQRIADQCKNGALTLPQAVNRLREIEAPIGAMNR